MRDDGTYMEFDLAGDEANPWSTHDSSAGHGSHDVLDASPMAPAASRVRSASQQLSPHNAASLEMSPHSPSRSLGLAPTNSARLTFSPGLDSAEDGDLGSPQMSTTSLPGRSPDRIDEGLHELDLGHVEAEEFDMSEQLAVFDGSSRDFHGSGAPFAFGMKETQVDIRDMNKKTEPTKSENTETIKNKISTTGNETKDIDTKETKYEADYKATDSAPDSFSNSESTPGPESSSNSESKYAPESSSNSESKSGPESLSNSQSKSAPDASSKSVSQKDEKPPAYVDLDRKAQSEPATATPPEHIRFDETRMAETMPSTPTNKRGLHHKKSSSLASHYEYHQDTVGHIEKSKVYDENGMPAADDEEAEDEESSWQAMPTVGSHEMYDDKNNLVMAIHKDAEEEENAHKNAAASGYSRVANKDDAASINSLDDHTDYSFDHHKVTDDVDADFQMASTKSMLTDQQKIAYAGLCRLVVAGMAARYSRLGAKSQASIESLQVWGRDAMSNSYSHLGSDNDEQIMIESSAAHNLVADDSTPVSRQIQKVESNGDIMPEDSDDEDSDGIDEKADSSKREGDDGEEHANAGEVHASDLHEEIPKSLDKSIEVDVKWTVMCDSFSILSSQGTYDARSRTLSTLVASKSDVSAKEVSQFERKVTDVSQIDDDADQDWTEKDIIERRRRKALRRKYAYVGLATVGGGLVIGSSAGLLAPIVGAGLAGASSTIGIAGTSSFSAGTGGAVVITTASTAIGATVGSRAMSKRAGHVKTFEFRPIYNVNRVNVIITVGGWMTGKDDDVRLPFSTIDPVMGDVMSVHWEPEMMRSLGQTINISATEASAFGVQQILAATVFTVLMGALQAPMWLAKLSYLVDNPWSVSLDRAWAAGLILADSLMKRKLGNRPATLVGYGLGARMIYSCSSELGRRDAFGLVQDVFSFGTPVFYQKKDFARARAMVSGRFVNGYSRKDWILAFLFPAAKRYGNVSGLDCLPEKETEDFDVENMDVSEEVDGHMSYRSKMPVLMKMCGIAVSSEEFDEIEDPDPEQSREKQRKSLGESNTAEKPKKSGFFSGWGFDFMQRAKSKVPLGSTVTDPASGGDSGANSRAGSEAPNGPREDPPGGTVIFDVDALREELETSKPRMDYEQEKVPLPEHNQNNMPLEFAEYEPEPTKPSAAMDYDDPESPKPPPYSARFNDIERKHVDEKPSKVQLQFDDLE